MDRRDFFLGCSQPHWLGQEPAPGEEDTPLFVAVHRLERYLATEDWPVARVRWAMDSGGYNHLRAHGRWTVSAADYVDRVWTHAMHIGGMVWAAPQDWMCEDDVLAITGLTVADHQRLTLGNYLECVQAWQRLDAGRDWWRTPAQRSRLIWPAGSVPIVPVLQGRTLGDYVRHAEAYYAAGVPLHKFPVVGLGSVCRRQRTGEIVDIVGGLIDQVVGLKLHGFGMKTGAFGRDLADLLVSADSHAWSKQAADRRLRCTHPDGVRWEANCRLYAHEWRWRALRNVAEFGPPVQPLIGYQPELI